MSAAPEGQSPRTVFIKCEMPAEVKHYLINRTCSGNTHGPTPLLPATDTNLL